MCQLNWRSGPILMRVQSALYGYEEAAADQADIILQRVVRGKSDAQIVESLCCRGGFRFSLSFAKEPAANRVNSAVYGFSSLRNKQCSVGPDRS